MNTHVNKKKKQKTYIQPIPFKSKHKSYSKDYAIDLTRHMLTYCTDLTYIKKITGLSLIKMLELKLIEYYYPFKKRVYKENSIVEFTIVEDTNVSWLRVKVK